MVKPVAMVTEFLEEIYVIPLTITETVRVVQKNNLSGMFKEFIVPLRFLHVLSQEEGVISSDMR